MTSNLKAIIESSLRDNFGVLVMNSKVITIDTPRTLKVKKNQKIDISKRLKNEKIIFRIFRK